MALGVVAITDSNYKSDKETLQNKGRFFFKDKSFFSFFFQVYGESPICITVKTVVHI